MKIYCSKYINRNPRADEYYTYLHNHIQGVIDSWYNVLLPVMQSKGESEARLAAIGPSIEQHDKSKYGEEEFTPYCNHYYPALGFESDEKEYDKAWLHHQHFNPHHHQHWIIHHDDGTAEAVDMPLKYVCEMLCDWHSFSRRDPDSTAYSWWLKTKDDMILSASTYSLVAELVQCLQEPLQ